MKIGLMDTNGLPRFLERIRNAVFKATGLRFNRYTTESRRVELFYARMLFAHQAKNMLSEREIGELLKRHRTTVIVMLKGYDNEITHNPRFKRLAEIVEREMNNNKKI